MQTMFSNHMELEISNMKKCGKSTNIRLSHNKIINNPWVKEENPREIKKL